MKKKVINALLEMGMPADINGFYYIVDAMILLEQEEWRKCKITALYYKIAKDNKTTASRVERSIRHAFGLVLTKGKLDAVQKWLTFLQPTNGNLLKTLFLRLTQEE